jgi:hypothetical protein
MGVDPISAGLMGGQGVMNLISGNSAQQAQHGQYSAASNFLQRKWPAIEALYGQAQGALGAGFDQAQALTKGYGQSAKRDIFASGQQNQASAVDNSISRGLWGNSYLGSLQRGIASDTSRQMSGVDENTAMMLSNLLKQKGMAQSGLFSQEAGALQGMSQSELSAVTGFQHTGNQSNLSGLMSMFGGMFGGGGGGSGGGGGMFFPGAF